MGEMAYKYGFVKTWDDLHKLVKYCKSTGYASTDFETTGAPSTYPGAKPTILGVSFQPGSAWIIPLAHFESPFKNNNEWIKILKYFGREVIENPDIIKVGQNIKFEMSWWKHYGVVMLGRVFDTMLEKYLLDEERPHGLKEMVSRFIPEFDGYDLTGQPSSKAPREKIIEFWSNVPIKTLSKYCALDSDLTLRLHLFFEPRIIKGGFYPLLRNMLMMASRVLNDAEYRGMDIDMEYLDKLEVTYRIKIETCENDIRKLPSILLYEKNKVKQNKVNLIDQLKSEIDKLREDGASDRMIKNREEKISRYIAGDFITKKELAAVAPLNFASPKQMVDLLFESPFGLGLDPIEYTESGSPSTGEESLKELMLDDETGFIGKLLELRGLSKIYSTYIKGMQDKVTSRGKIHGSFLIHGTVSGRLSSRDPNLQNIPRSQTNADIKQMFITPPGKVMLQLDYSQAELRVMAFEAQEDTMMGWFQTGKDIHLASAAKTWDVDYDDALAIYKNDEHPDNEIWVIRRKKAKTTNFGIIYGQTAPKLAINLATDGHKVSIKEAQGFLDDFKHQFPNVDRFIKNQERTARRYGYVKNLFGRKRRLPNVYSDVKGIELEALRQSVNAPIQGAASDYALFSSILIWEAIRSGKLPQSLEQVGTVHDSLIYYIDPNDLAKALPIMGDICANPETLEWFGFEVEGLVMAVDFEVGTNWGNLKSYSPDIDYNKVLQDTINK